MEAHRDKFIGLVKACDETGCLECIAKYDDFYNAIAANYSGINMLQLACLYRLEHVALTLIDRKCDMRHRDNYGSTALMYAICYGLTNVVADIINKSDVATRITLSGSSEMIYLSAYKDEKNIIKMINRGYYIYYKNDRNESLFTEAIVYKLKEVMQKLIDIDTCFAEEFNILYRNMAYMKDEFYHNIIKYCVDKRASYKYTIIATMNDATPTNALYQSFHTTYAVQLVDIICDFILLPI